MSLTNNKFLYVLAKNGQEIRNKKSYYIMSIFNMTNIGSAVLKI